MPPPVLDSKTPSSRSRPFKKQRSDEPNDLQHQTDDAYQQRASTVATVDGFKRLHAFCYHFSRDAQREQWNSYSVDLQEHLHTDFLRLFHLLASHNFKRLMMAIRLHRYDPYGRVHW